MKKVSIGKKPVPGSKPTNPDEWVNASQRPAEAREGGGERMKRLTVDVPLSLHTRIKSQCALQSVQMADVIRDLLDKQFPG